MRWTKFVRMYNSNKNLLHAVTLANLIEKLGLLRLLYDNKMQRFRQLDLIFIVQRQVFVDTSFIFILQQQRCICKKIKIRCDQF